MPVTRAGRVSARAITVLALTLAVIVVAYLFFANGSSYHVYATFESASQLVNGDEVEVGGVPVGSIDSIKLDNRAQARIEMSISDSSLAPLHDGSRVEIRSASLSGVANRYIALSPGPNNRPSIPDGGTLPGDDATSEVDLDQVLNTLNPSTLHDLQQFTHGSASALAGRAPQLASALTSLDPALVQGDQVERQIIGDEPRFSRFLVESASVVSTVASRSGDLAQLVPSTRATLDELAAHDSDVDSLLRRLPPTLRLTNTTLVNLRNTLVDADPTVKAAQPVAQPLAVFLERLGPVAHRALPVVQALERTIDRPGSNDLLGVLGGVPALAQVAVPTFRSTVSTVNAALPIVNDIRPYTPDVVAGLANGFGGTTSGYYDANGHYTRISFQSGVYSFNGLGSLLPIPSNVPGLTGYRRGLMNRCPGAAAQAAADGSNPVHVSGCDPGEDP